MWKFIQVIIVLVILANVLPLAVGMITLAFRP